MSHNAEWIQLHFALNRDSARLTAWFRHKALKQNHWSVLTVMLDQQKNYSLSTAPGTPWHLEVKGWSHTQSCSPDFLRSKCWLKPMKTRQGGDNNSVLIFSCIPLQDIWWWIVFWTQETSYAREDHKSAQWCVKESL